MNENKKVDSMESYVKPEMISLKGNSEYSEKWVQKIISNDPSILGLGDLFIKDTERVQQSGGRLDLLLYDPDGNRRYEVELQLGSSDPSHIIRTIEYWDYERRRYPQYEHCAVLVAEDITSRFLNVISLFNGFIPIIAIQMKAVKIGDSISLIFTTVVDALTLGTEEEDEGETVDRNYWKSKASKETLKLTDELFKLTHDFAPGYVLKYNKYYIGVSIHGVAQNFVCFIPRRTTVIFHFRHDVNEDIQKRLDSTDLDVLNYDRYWRQYRIRLKKNDLKENGELLKELMKMAYESYMR